MTSISDIGLASPHAIKSVMTFHHQAQSRLCDCLERIADTLPDQVDKQECLLLVRSLLPLVKQAHDFEESVLFPHLQRVKQDDSLDLSIERLRFEHWEDESFAEDLAIALKRYVTIGGGRSESEKLAYMLHGFFEGVRRHMAFEQEHLLPLLEVSDLACKEREPTPI